MVFQEPYDSLNPRMRIWKTLEEPLKFGHQMTPRRRQDRVAEVLDMVRLGSGAMGKYPHQFSAGEQQRIGKWPQTLHQPVMLSTACQHRDQQWTARRGAAG